MGLLALTLIGCAVGRSEVDISVLPPQAEQAQETVTIIEIRDLRRFAVSPGDASLPSLATQAEVDDLDLRERTLGRTRNAYGMRMGDIVLPEGESVSDLVREAATTALEERGYRVVDDITPGVVPVSIDVEQFWAWFETGLFKVTLHFESRLRLYGPELFEDTPTVVGGTAATSTAIARKATWIEVIEDGLDDLVLKLRTEMKPAEPHAPSVDRQNRQGNEVARTGEIEAISPRGESASSAAIGELQTPAR